MFQHGFNERARAILARAEAAADSEILRQRVGLLQVGVVYVEAVRLFMQMREGQTPPDLKRYAAVADELGALCQRLKIENLGFYDGSRTIA